MKCNTKVILAMALMIGITTVGCQKNDIPVNKSQSTDEATVTPTMTNDLSEVTSEKITLKVWESEDGSDEFIKEAGKEFKKQYPNINIKFENVEVANTATKIIEQEGAGSDIFVTHHDRLGELVKGEYILPVRDQAYVKENALQACTSAVTYDEQIYGYPVASETYALFYNKDLISAEQVPKTWEDLKEFCQTFNESNNGKYGFMMEVDSGYYTILFTTSKNNRLFGPTGQDISNTNINTEASKQGMKFFKSLRTILDVPPEDLTVEKCDEAFAAGNVALYRTGPWNIKKFQEAGINFGVTTLPSLPGETTPAASFSGTRAMVISSKTKHPVEADLFAKFLMSEKMQKLRFQLTDSLPAIDCDVDSSYVPGLLKQLEYAFPMPSVPQMQSYWMAMKSTCENIWNGADIDVELTSCNNSILAY